MEKIPGISIRFLGAAGMVTGSKHLLTLGSRNILIDCGLFQGEDEKLMNNHAMTFDPRQVDCMLLTHGHLDHTGFIPVVVRKGFRGKIYGTTPTLQITEIILKDSAKVAEEEKKLTRKKTPKGHVVPDQDPWQYTAKEAEASIRLFSSVEPDEWLTLYDDIAVRFRYSGHILGACFIEIKYDGKYIVFSGDIGRPNDFLLHPPKQPERADVLVIESTYGDRLHRKDVEAQFIAVLNEAASRKGTIIIPSFAVERAQLLMFMLWQMKMKGSIPKLPVYVDSPMARSVMQVFHNNGSWHKLTIEDTTAMTASVKTVQSIKETYDVIDMKHPKIVIAGSGMVTGGRVLTYLQYYIERDDTTILLPGFQAKGTNGRLLQEGAEKITIRGKEYNVNATVRTLEGLSGHADQNELIDWMSKLAYKPEAVYIVHGEEAASTALRDEIAKVYQVVPEVARLDGFPATV